MVKIFGYKLPIPTEGLWVSSMFAEEGDEYVVSPEEDFCEACHLYTDISGKQFVGFDVRLGMTKEEMEKILGRKGRIYKVTISDE